MSRRKDTRLLIDGDHIVYAAAAAVEKTVEWDDEVSTVWADREAATEAVTRYVERHKEEFDAKEVLFAVSNSKDTFRHQLFPDYKKARATVRRPVILGWLRRWTVDNLGAKAIDNLEADDVIGISATHPKWHNWRQVIVTEDKDLKTIPGELYFPSRDELVKVNTHEANLHFYCQALGGDAVDGFPGCPGIGYKTARELLSGLEGVTPYEHTFKSGPRKGATETRWEPTKMDTYWDVVVSHYAKAGLSEEEALVQARVAYILQHHNYDFKKGEIIHWTP